MAELLVYKGPHWMDVYPTADDFVATMLARGIIKTEKDQDIARRQYESRYQAGDIIEVRPDGYYTTRKLSKKEQLAFVVVKVPGEPDQSMIDPDETVEQVGTVDGTPEYKHTTIKRRRYRVDTANMSPTLDPDVMRASLAAVEDKRG